MKALRSLLLALTGWAAIPLPAAVPPEPASLVLSGGAAGVFSDRSPAVFGAEYRFGENYRGIHPYLLAGWATDGSTYLGAGLFYQFVLSPRWRVTIGSGPGYYQRNRSPRDLGDTIEFYSNLELSASVWRDHRLGLSFGHISNGGLGNRNPGSETLRLVYVVPLRR